MAKAKTAYFCQECGYNSPKWVGKCPSCGEWNTFVQEVIEKEDKKPTVSGNRSIWQAGQRQLQKYNLKMNRE